MGKQNVFTAELTLDPEDPEGYRSAVADIARTLNLKDLSVRIYEVPAGQSVCPYHYEYEQEWLLVLEGSIVLRTPDGEQTLERGDITAFPSGPAGAHKTTNREETPARLLMFSSGRVPALAVYPDSDKLGVYLADEDSADELLLRRSDGSVGYYDGET